MKQRLLLMLLILLLAPAARMHAQDSVTMYCIVPDSVVAEAMKYMGVPYKWGGKTPKGFDCAGFTRYVYGKFGVSLPPSAGSQYKMGIHEEKEGIGVGDLVFYAGRRQTKTIGHVGLVTAVHDGWFEFIHASSTGIRITSSTEPYYQKRYIGACRLIDREEVKDAGLPMESNDTATHEPLFTIAMVGDIMLGTLHPTPQLPRNNGRNLFDDTKQILRQASFAMGNCEGVFCEDSIPSTKEGCAYCYAFRMPPSYAGLLKDAGFDFMSLGNNHTYDFGFRGLDETMCLFDSLGIAYAGIRRICNTAIVQKDSVTYGICAFGTNSHNLSLMDSTLIRNTIRALRDSCDLLIVSFHGGAEGKDYSHLPDSMEVFLDENRGHLRWFAHFCIDEGADLVFGHGPHVCRAMEVYKGHLIAYSLGNFCTPTGINVRGVLGIAPIISARVDKNGMLVDGQIYSFLQPYRMGPRKDPSRRAVELIRMLSFKDFDNPRLVIEDDGSFRPSE